MENWSHATRRDMLRFAGCGALGIFSSGWISSLAAFTAPQLKPHKSVILLWMNGGPATIDLWDLKPRHENGGPFREIATTATGMKFSEHLPGLARRADALAIVRSMATREGDHQRATIVGTTGYTPQGAIQFPAIGSVVAHELHDPAADLPGFITIGRRPTSVSGGFLGSRCAPFQIGSQRRDAAAQADDLEINNLLLPAGMSEKNHSQRLALRAELEQQFSSVRGQPIAESVRAATERALSLMRPETAAAFQLEQEAPRLREQYGRGLFGQGCLLARRLIERGVPFIEVSLDGWDTHNDNFARVQALSSELDRGFSSLITDLNERGMLEDTLIVCQGEFGRTPRINGQAGRDHWPASWSVVLAGGGIQGGLVYGQTSPDGTQVESQPTRIADLVATIMTAIGLDPMKQNMSNVARPIRLADPDGKPIKELL